MIDLNWANEQRPQGYTKEQIERAREQQTQVDQSQYQRTRADAQRLAGVAQQLIEIAGLSGQARSALQNALAWPLDPPNIAEAVRQLNAAVEWGNRDRQLLGMTPVPPPQQRATQQAQPRTLSLEEQVRQLAARVDALERQQP